MVKHMSPPTVDEERIVQLWIHGGMAVTVSEQDLTMQGQRLDDVDLAREYASKTGLRVTVTTTSRTTVHPISEVSSG